MGQFNHQIFVVGDGRSGTTLLGELLNPGRIYMEMFEPFHPHFNEPLKGYPLYPIITPDETADHFDAYAHAVFTGQYYSGRTHGQNTNALYHGVMIKDIFSQLCLKRIRIQYPALNMIFIMRHPFATSLSKFKKNDWIWMREPEEFFQRPKVQQQLLPYSDLLNTSNNQWRKYLLIWCVVHHLMLQQINRDDVHVVFYEEILLRPWELLEELFTKLGSQSVFLENKEEIQKTLTTGNVCTKEIKESTDEMLEGWKSEISEADQEWGWMVLQRFNFDQVYGRDEVLNPNAHENLFQRLV